MEGYGIMATKTWKAIEKRVAEILGGERVGVTGLNTEDVSHDIFSVEVKHGKSIPKFVTEAFKQCKRNRPADKIPLVVLHATGSSDYLCVIEAKDLANLLEGHGYE